MSTPDFRGRLAVLSDVHANANAFRAALAESRRRGFDRLVILGDLLTYGCQPLEVLELTREAQERFGADLVMGNHDQIYFDLMEENEDSCRRLPDWVRESIDWTLSTIDGTDLRHRFCWREEVVLGDLLLAHANPFGYGDWTYLDGENVLARAGEVMRAARRRLGVFGHTHRALVGRIRSDGALTCTRSPRRLSLPLAAAGAVLVNPGSVGQPRSADRAATFLLLDAGERGLELEFVELDYDLSAHLEALYRSTLSATTRSRLRGFFP